MIGTRYIENITNIETMKKEKIGMNSDMDRLADLLADLIEKYIDKIDLNKLPEPLKPTDV